MKQIERKRKAMRGLASMMYARAFWLQRVKQSIAREIEGRGVWASVGQDKEKRSPRDN